MSEKIIVLSDKDQARLRINVFHGSANNYINMFKELIGNSHDIFNPGVLNTIQIILHNSNKIEYIDSGKGIPVEGTASDGRPNYEAIFERAFAGSKYSNTAATVGQNGIFLYTLSMTCEDIEYYIARPNKNLYYISYHKGDRVSDLKVIGKEDIPYSRIIFSLDNEVWNNPHFTYEGVCEIAKAQASLGNVKITVEDKQSNQLSEFYFPNGIEDYFKEMITDKSTVIDNININKTIEYNFDKIINGEKIKLTDNISVELIFNYSNDANEDFQKEFLNTADLLLHGTIQDGIYNGLKNSIHKWLKSNNKYEKNEKPISIDDVSTGLNYICNVSSKFVEYDNQIKQKTSVSHYKDVLQSCIGDFLEIFFIENVFVTERLCMQVLINNRSRLNAEKSRLDIKKKLSEKVDNISSRIEGLVDCKFHNEDSELFIAEGKSALGSIILSRNPNFQAGYAIRGKILSCLKASYETIFSNAVVVDLIKIMGCGVEVKSKHNKDLNSFNIDNLRYGKIVISTDSDFDGESIQVLLLTMIYRLMPELLKQEKIYIAQTPKYVIKYKDEKHYAFTDNEKDEIVKSINGKVHVNYLKGLGELNSIDMYNTALNVETRKMVKVTIGNVEEMIKKFEIWMSDEVPPRKQFIEAHLHEYINDLD
jgi:DNA gyrase subunit B